MKMGNESSAALEQLIGELADEFTQHVERGDQPDVEEYVGRHPQLADLLRKMLPTLAMIPQHARNVASANLPSDGVLSGRAQEVQGTLGDYRILRQIGRGGMGVVYEAEQITLQRRVALKILPFAAMLDERQLKRFRNEALAAASLDHPHIVEIYAVGCERGVHFYAMRFVEGRSLADLLNDQFRQHLERGTAAELADAAALSTTATDPVAVLTTREDWERGKYWRRVAQLGRQVAEALEHAHEHGVVHRDVKPGNLLLDTRGKIWITDFGLAHVETASTLTLTGDLVGTIRYMSPEQALAKRVPLDHRTDVYSLGVTLYELLTLRPAFTGNDRHEILRQIAFEEPKPPTRVNPAIPTELETIVLKAMAKNPAERYATAKEIADDLGRFLEDQPIHARRPTVLQRTGKWVRRHKAGMWTFGVTAVVMVVLAVASLVTSNYLIHAAFQVTLGDLTKTTQALDQEKTKLQLLTQLEKTRALRNTLQPGRRFAGEEELRNAARLYATLAPDEPTLLALRREWIATTALSPDLRSVRKIPGLDCSFAKDLQRYAILEPGPRLRIRHLSDDREDYLLPQPNHVPTNARIFSVESSPDGRFLAVGYGRSQDRTFQTWDLLQKSEALEPIRNKLGECPPTFTSDSRVMYYYLPDEPRTSNYSIRRFDLLNRKHLAPLSTGTAVPSAVTFARNAPRAAIGLGRRELQVIDLTTDALIRSFPLGAVGWSALSPDGRRVALVPRRNTIHVHNVDTGRLEQMLVGHSNLVVNGEFGADPNLLFSGAWDGNPRYWDCLTGRELGRFRDGGDFRCMSTDGSRLAYQTAKGGEILEIVPSPIYARVETDLTEERDAVSGSIAFSPDGRFLVLASSAGARVCDPVSRRVVAVIDDGHCGSVCFDAAGRLVTSSQRNGLRRWPIQGNLASDEVIIGPPAVLVPLSRGGKRLACLTPDGQTGAVLDGDQVLVFHSSQQDVERLEGSHGAAEHVAISPDGRWIATADRFRDVAVKLWDRRAGRLLKPDLWSAIGVETIIGFTPDGKWLQAMSLSGTMRTWEVGSWRLVAEFVPAPGAYSHDGAVRALRIENELIQLQCTRTGQTLATLDPPAPAAICGGWNNGVAFTRTGDKLAVMTERYVHVWDLRQIRKGLAELGLDWALPPYPPPAPTVAARPLRVQIDYGVAKASPPELPK